MSGRSQEVMDEVKAVADRLAAGLSAEEQRGVYEGLEQWAAQEVKDLDDYETDVSPRGPEGTTGDGE